MSLSRKVERLYKAGLRKWSGFGFYAPYALPARKKRVIRAETGTPLLPARMLAEHRPEGLEEHLDVNLQTAIAHVEQLE